MTLYQNKFRVETTRLKNWNYASDGWYFITICTKGRENIFGIIEHGIMILNQYGRIVEQCWFDLPNHYFNLILDAFVIMPNHLHGIMIIDNTRETIVSGNADGGVSVNGGVGLSINGVVVETGFKPVSTDTQPNMNTQPQSNTQPQPNTQPQSSTTKHGIFEFARALKTFSSRRMNELDITAGKSRWQSRFHDHIIRDEEELHRIQQYIFNNPSTWEKDSLK